MIIRIDRGAEGAERGQRIQDASVAKTQRAEGKKSKNDIPQGFRMTGLRRGAGG
jgi:hypothetical protein